jgi:hypothetical protein
MNLEELTRFLIDLQQTGEEARQAPMGRQR